jgi:hypothetical protein
MSHEDLVISFLGLVAVAITALRWHLAREIKTLCRSAALKAHRRVS